MKIVALKVEIGRTTEALREKELVIETMSAVRSLEQSVTVGEEPSADSRQSVDNRQSVGSQVRYCLPFVYLGRGREGGRGGARCAA